MAAWLPVMVVAELHIRQRMLDRSWAMCDVAAAVSKSDHWTERCQKCHTHYGSVDVPPDQWQPTLGKPKQSKVVCIATRNVSLPGYNQSAKQ